MAFELSVVDVGHGNSAVLVDSNGVVVIDAGPRSSLLEFLRGAGISRIAVILISHADEDHLGGLLALLSAGEVTVDRIRLNTDSAQRSAVWSDLVYELDQRRRSGVVDFQPLLQTDLSGQYDVGAVRVEIVGPSSYLAARGPGSSDTRGRRITTNSISAVVRLVLDGRGIAVFCGDLDPVGLHELVRIGATLEASMLVFPHHGGRTGSAPAEPFIEKLIALVDPSTVVFSIGRGRHGTPRPEVVSAVMRAKPAVRIVCTQLSENCAAEEPRSGPTHLTGAFAEGRAGNSCCGGTLVVRSVQRDDLLPTLATHSAFISSSAPTALCRG